MKKYTWQILYQGVVLAHISIRTDRQPSAIEFGLLNAFRSMSLVHYEGAFGLVAVSEWDPNDITLRLCRPD